MEKGQPPAYSPPAPGFQHPHEYQPPPPGPAPPLQHTVIVTQGPVISLGPQPCSITCPSCHAQILTTVRTEPNTKTHLFALILCLFACWICCCIPYCMDTCQSQQHYCPNCGTYIGAYNN